MPIIGLTTGQRQFLKLGQIRKGDKQTITKKRSDGSTYVVEKPIDLDYFRVTFHSKESEAEKIFRETYGERPAEIRVRFAFPEIDQVWDANYECYAKGGLIAKAASTPERGLYWLFYRDHTTGEVLIRNGEAAVRRGHEILAKPIKPEEPIYTYKNLKGEDVGAFLEPVGRLQVVIPEVAQVQVGYFEFRPNSPTDIRNISAELAAYDLMARSAGKTICGIPFKILRREEEVTVNIDGKLSKKASWVVHLNIDSAEWTSRALAYQERLALPDVIEGHVVTTPVEEADDWEDHSYPPEPEYEEEEPPAHAAPAQPAAPAQEKAKRPYRPQELKSMLAETAGKMVQRIVKGKEQAPTEQTRNVLGKALKEIFPDDSDRYAFTRWVAGAQNGSVKALSDDWVLALQAWTKVKDFNDTVDPLAKGEGLSALSAALEAQGQGTLL